MRQRLFPFAITLVSLLFACQGGGPGGSASSAESEASSDSEEPIELSSAPDGAIVTVDGNPALKANDHYLVFKKSGDGYGLAIQAAEGSESLFSQENPIKVSVRGKSSGVLETFKETSYSAPYASCEEKPYGFDLKGQVSTSAGSVFEVLDRYGLVDGSFVVYRKASITKAVSDDYGFSTTYSVSSDQAETSYSDFEYFIPSIIYKDTSNMSGGAIASVLDLDKVYVKETRTGLPMAMIRGKNNGASLSLSHFKPEISCGGMVGGGSSGATDEMIRYGGLGFSILPTPSVDFIYPCAEGPVTYDNGSTWARRYHPVEEGFSHSYAIALYADGSDTYNDAFVNSFEEAYLINGATTKKISMDEIYQNNIDVFKAEYQEMGTGEIHTAGLPWQLDLPDATPGDSSYQMGFVGQQMPLAAHLYHYGIENGDETAKADGETILNFWTSDAIMGTYFPTVWWDAADNSAGGTRRDYPCFLRCMIDGLSGLLDAYIYSVEAGEANNAWLTRLTTFTDNLVAKQNEDGSFCRAYNVDGSVNTDNTDVRFQGSSTLNTPIAVRFIAEMYELTGNESYKTSALNAASYCYTELYEALGKYVGGTPDNPNTVDKEAAIYALYAFNAAYTLSDDAKYLKAAEHAACCSLSWTYLYDFAVPSQTEGVSECNPFEEGGTIGFSLIATGHSAADNCSAYLYYDLYRLYLQTDKAVFKDAAILLENGTKLCTDYDGRMGWKYKALCPEASNISDFSFQSVNTWLPWSGVANIDPILKFRRTFGVSAVEDLTSSLEEQKSALAAFGNGGYANEWTIE